MSALTCKSSSQDKDFIQFGSVLSNSLDFVGVVSQSVNLVTLVVGTAHATVLTTISLVVSVRDLLLSTWKFLVCSSLVSKVSKRLLGY